ncbi:MAG: hypothetical protein OEZ22_11165 [Spirochaetia bacterium]|nr:hypothetical protein [Spirochaetia bacterium]
MKNNFLLMCFLLVLCIFNSSLIAEKNIYEIPHIQTKLEFQSSGLTYQESLVKTGNFLL